MARAAGVSTATVSRALNETDKLAPETLAAVEEAVRRLGYRQNKIARSLVTKSTQTIAIVLPDITNPFYAGLVKGVQDVAHRDGYLLLSAIGVLVAARERGLRVPEDLSVVGFDDLRLAEHVTPPLTTIRQPAYEMGSRATEMLLAAIHGRRADVEHGVLPPELVVRNSTSAPR